MQYLPQRGLPTKFWDYVRAVGGVGGCVTSYLMHWEYGNMAH